MSKFCTTFAPAIGNKPHMVRWMSGLVNGLQNRVHPFESGTHLQRTRKRLNGHFGRLSLTYHPKAWRSDAERWK